MTTHGRAWYPRPMSHRILLASVLLVSGCDLLFGGWSVSSHPCVGNRTDALWFDDARTGWVGCGTTTSGYGLFTTADGGRTWAEPSTEPGGYFSGFRVGTISRSADGLLYVGGSGSGVRVAAIDTTRSPAQVTPVLENMGQTWNSFQVGSFRRAADGRALAESLTGVDVAWRASDTAAWQNGYGWWQPEPAVQILDMVEFEGRFYGAGSTISQPPFVMLPEDESGGVGMVPHVLDTRVMGEMWGIAVDQGGIALGGVNQGSAVGVVFTTPGDGADPDAWQRTDVANVVTETGSTWVRGVCRSGPRIVAVGEYSRASTGLVIESLDGGQSWSDRTPAGSPSLHKCVLLPDGTVAVAGADGYFARR